MIGFVKLLIGIGLLSLVAAFVGAELVDIGIITEIQSGWMQGYVLGSYIAWGIYKEIGCNLS